MTYNAPATAAVRARQIAAAEDWPTAYVAVAESLNPVVTAVDPRERITSDAFNEGWVCACGNDIMGAGFAPCDPATGAEVEPTIDGPWDGKSIGCGECGRIMDATTNQRGPDGTWTVAVVGKIEPPECCPTCDGYGMTNSDGTQPGSPPGLHGSVNKCSTCKGTGKITVGARR